MSYMLEVTVLKYYTVANFLGRLYLKYNFTTYYNTKKEKGSENKSTNQKWLWQYKREQQLWQNQNVGTVCNLLEGEERGGGMGKEGKGENKKKKRQDL